MRAKTEARSSRPEDDDRQPLQGEGNYEAARRFRQAEEAFVRSGRVGQAARDAAPRTPEQAKALEEAERRGRAPAKS